MENLAGIITFFQSKVKNGHELAIYIGTITFYYQMMKWVLGGAGYGFILWFPRER